MAAKRGRIEQEIVITTTGVKEVKEAEKVVNKFDKLGTTKVKIDVDVDTQKAQTAFGSLKKSVQEAQGLGGKTKALASGLTEQLGVSVGTAAAAAGSALVAFGVKAVAAFGDTAKAAKDLSAATGLSIEDASRWIAISDDFKVSAGDLQSALGRVLKTLDKSVWAQYGIATRDASGKVRDASDILVDALATLSRIPGETARAEAGTKLFGKGFANIAPLLGHTRDEYQKMLNTVEQGQVITSKESATAERMRLAQDGLNDAIQEVTLSLGQFLSTMSPVVESLADGVRETSEFIDVLNKIPGGMPTFVGMLQAQANPLNAWNALMSAATESTDASHASLQDWAKAAHNSNVEGQDLVDWWKAWADSHPDTLLADVGNAALNAADKTALLASNQSDFNEIAKQTPVSTAEAISALNKFQQQIVDLAAAEKKAQDDADKYAESLDAATGQLIEMDGSFSRMKRNEDAIKSAFDLGNAPLDARQAVVDVNDAIRDLGKFIEKEGTPFGKGGVFNPRDVDAGPFLDKIRSLRTPIQQAVADAFATGGPAAAQATADAYVKQIVASLHGKLTKDQVRSLLGLDDLTATLKVAVDQESMAEAQKLLEILTGVAGNDVWTADIKLALQAGDITADAAKILIGQRLKDVGLDVPLSLLEPTAESKTAAKAKADRWAADHPIGIHANVDDPTERSLVSSHAFGQDYANGHPVVWPSTVAFPTNPGRMTRFDQGGTAGAGGGIAGERGPEILNERFLALGPTLVPPGTRVTSRVRTTQILRTRGTQGLRRYDSGGVVGGPTTMNINVNTAVVGNRYDVARSVRKAGHDIIRLYGSRG